MPRLLSVAKTPKREPSQLGRRVEWVVALAKAEGRHPSARAFSEAAGFSHSMASQLIVGTIQDSTNDVIQGFARAGDVDARWLASGEGQPRPGLDAPAFTGAPGAVHATARPLSATRTSDAVYWARFAEMHPTFDEVAEVTRSRAARENWAHDLDAVLNIAAKRLPRFYGGGTYTHADVRKAVEQAIVVANGGDPDEAMPPKVVEPTAPAPHVPPSGMMANLAAAKPKKRAR